MKNKQKYFYPNLKFYITSPLFKTIFILLIFITFIETMEEGFDVIYLEDILYIYTSNVFLLSTCILLYLNTINTFRQFEKNSFMILRLKTKDAYNREFLKQVFINNALLLLIQLVLIVLGCSLTVFFCAKYRPYHTFYTFPTVFYLIFYFIKCFTLLQLLSLIFAPIMQVLKPKGTCPIFIMLIALLMTGTYEPYLLEHSLLPFPIALLNYFQLVKYSNFIHEISAACLCIMVLYGIFQLIRKTTLRYIKNIGDLL